MFKHAEAATEAIFLIARLESRIIAKTRYSHAPHCDRMIDRVGEQRGYPRRGEDIRGQHRAGGVFRAGECEQIG